MSDTRRIAVSFGHQRAPFALPHLQHALQIAHSQTVLRSNSLSTHPPLNVVWMLNIVRQWCMTCTTVFPYKAKQFPGCAQLRQPVRDTANPSKQKTPAYECFSHRSPRYTTTAAWNFTFNCTIFKQQIVQIETYIQGRMLLAILTSTSF